MRYLNTRNWSADGSKKVKREFLSLLVESGVRAFDGRKTAKHIIEEGSIIKGVDFNRKGDTGVFFISSHEQVNNLTHFHLDACDLNWVLEFILKK